jgi:hypothetical protein
MALTLSWTSPLAVVPDVVVAEVALLEAGVGHDAARQGALVEGGP